MARSTKTQTAQSFVASFLLRAANQTARHDLDATTNSVLLRKRYKDMGSENWFGVFDSYGTWTVPNTRNLYPLNIIQPMIKANTAALVSANVKINIEPRALKDVQAEMVADVSRAIRDLKTEEQWTHQLVEQVATEPQMSAGVFLWVDWDKDAQSQFISTIDEWETDEWAEGGRAICSSCGMESDVGEILGESPTVECECGGMAEVIEAPESMPVDVIKGTKTFKSGNTTTKIIPSAEICIDDRGTWGGNIDAARWIIHRYLEPKDDLEAKYPDQEGSGFGGASTDWSYSLRWQYAMQTGNDQPYYTPANWVDDLREVRDVYLTPDMYCHVQLSEDCKIGKFRASGTLANATYNGKSIKTDKGLPTLCFRTVGQQLIDVYPYEIKEKLIYITYLSNPSDFWGVFLTAMLPIQDVVNYMNSIQIFHTRRNARTTKVLDSGMYNPEDLEKDVVLTKEPLSPEQDIRSTFAYIPSATLSPVPQNLLQAHLAYAPGIGGVTPAMTGQPQEGETYSAVRQQKEQSLGQLLPFLKSTALGKQAWTVKQLKEFQANATEEDFLFLLKLNKEWTEEYVEAFLAANLDTDIIVEYEQGSDAPRNLLDREMALQQFIATLGQLSELSMMGSPLATPQLCGEILMAIKQFTQVDVDVNNFEAGVRLAEARSQKIIFLADQMQMPVDTPMEVLNMMASQLVALPDLMPFPFEKHEAEIEFYVDKIERELSKAEPSHLLVACWFALINSHKEAAVIEGQEASEAQVATQMPMIQAEQQMAQAGQPDAEQELKAEAAIRGMDSEQSASDQDHATRLAESEHAHDLEMKRLDMEDRAADRAHQIAVESKKSKQVAKKNG